MRPLSSNRGHSPTDRRSRLSSLPSRLRRNESELPEPDGWSARAPHPIGSPKRSADTKSVGSSPHATGPFGPMPRDTNPLPSLLPKELRRRVFTRLPSVRLFLDPRRSNRCRPSRSRVVPSTSGRCSACGLGTIPRRYRLVIALFFHGFLIPLQGTPWSSLHAHRSR
jgi:hypothetical protein